MNNDFDQFLDEDGNIFFRPGTTLVDFVERNAAERGGTLAYRFIDYSRERDGEVQELTWAQFGARLRAIGARLQHITKREDRVAILAPQGLDYVTAFFGALYAGNIAVPLFSPDEPGHTDRLRMVLEDCKPTAILTSTSSAEACRNFFRHLPAKERPRIIAVDAIPDTVGATLKPFPIYRDTIAYLQYTSGSTRNPAGVQITYEAVGTNVLQMIHALDLNENSRGVTWLPMFHDMGLLTVILPALGGKFITIMSPAAFVRRPGRWIRELAAMDDNAETFAAAPNFAYEHAAVRGLPRDGEELDLSNVKGLINGSEPVTVSSMQKFNDAFAPYGLPKEAIKPCYGMAEATLFVSSTPVEDAAKVVYVDREKLAAGTFAPTSEADEGSVPQVACGKVALSQWATIVDPETGEEQPDGSVGEIWLHGHNIGSGYWDRPEESRETFGNRVKPLAEGSHSIGVKHLDTAKWLRTGDFGVYYDGDLYITGRVKDLVIVDGRNHYPQDIEFTAQEANKYLRVGYVAAFSVPANELPKEVFENTHSGLTYDKNDQSEQLVIVAERAAGAHKVEQQPIADDVRAAVGAAHGVTVRDVLLVPAGSVPRTSSGKIARRACRAAYIDGTLRGGYTQTAFPDAEANDVK
jgi:fatty acid CoA ligase FadD32